MSQNFIVLTRRDRKVAPAAIDANAIDNDLTARAPSDAKAPEAALAA